MYDARGNLRPSVTSESSLKMKTYPQTVSVVESSSKFFHRNREATNGSIALSFCIILRRNFPAGCAGHVRAVRNDSTDRGRDPGATRHCENAHGHARPRRAADALLSQVD